MDLSRFWNARACLGLVLLAALSLVASAVVPARGQAAPAEDEEITWQLRQQLMQPLRQKVSKLASERNAEGEKNRRGIISKNFTKIDDDTYQVSFQQDTAGLGTQLTERLLLTLKRAGDERWEIAEEQVVDTYDKLHRTHGYRFHPFEKFSFDEGGLEVTASKGQLYEWYFDGEVTGFILMADDLDYEYTAPKYQNFYELQKMIEEDYAKDLLFKPELFRLTCDVQTCEEILATAFSGLDRPTGDQAGPVVHGPDGVPSWVDPKLKDRFKENHRKKMERRRDNPFSGFNRGTMDGNRHFWAAVQEDDKHNVSLRYDNWEGFEYQFYVYRDAPGATFYGPLFGYYTDETLANHTPYELELRDDQNARWHDLFSIKGEVEAALEDPETLRGDLEFGINLKRDSKELPFFIATIRRGANDKFKNPTMFVNSVQYEGQDLTCVRTGPYSYIVVFPEELPAGSEINLRVDFSSRVIYKLNHAYSAMARGGWLPFVRFGDMIDEIEMTVKVPSEYETLGIGRKVSEETEGDVRITQWIADSPVMFPTIIFGKYVSDEPRIKAKKFDGTEIPVRVYVDEVSMNQLSVGAQTYDQAENFIEDFSTGARGIRGKQLRPIGEQAVNSINLYREVSGLDYPYGELNIVNDPAPALYGQAPSSLIYLGSFVFRGEGTMAGDTWLGGGGGGTAKFLKSVTAHEVAHQWWGSRVANANSRNYWFVESLAEYFSALFLEFVHGKKEYNEQVEEWRKLVLEVDQRSSIQNSTALWAGESPFASYVAAIYNKGPLAFHVLRQTFGDQKFFDALKQFSIALDAKGEVVTEDLRMMAEEAFGGVGPDGNRYNADLSWFFDQWFRCAGIPEYAINYDVRQTEDGSWIVEGNVKQRVVVGNKSRHHVLDDTYYRGFVWVTVSGKGKEEKREKLVVQGAETPFHIKVAFKPRDVALNEDNEILSHDVLVNRDF